MRKCAWQGIIEMNHISLSELEHIVVELNRRFDALRQSLEAHPPKDAFDGAGPHSRWPHPERVRLFGSTASERRLAVADFKAILAQIASIK